MRATASGRSALHEAALRRPCRDRRRAARRRRRRAGPRRRRPHAVAGSGAGRPSRRARTPAAGAPRAATSPMAKAATRWCWPAAPSSVDAGAGAAPAANSASIRPRAGHEASARSTSPPRPGAGALVALLDPAYPLPAAVADGDARRDRRRRHDRAPATLLREGLRRRPLWTASTRWPRLLSPRELGALLHDAELAAACRTASTGCSPTAPMPMRATASRRTPPLFALLARGAGGAAGAAGAAAPRRVARPAPAAWRVSCPPASPADHAARGLEHCALDLLERGADPFAAVAAPAIRRWRWPCAWAGCACCSACVAHGVDLDARDSHGMTALHLAAALGREAALKALVAHGASPDVRAADGQTPLGVALVGRPPRSGRLARLARLAAAAAARCSAADLPAAAIVGDADAVRRLIDLGLPVDAIDAQGCTALLRAAGGGHRRGRRPAARARRRSAAAPRAPAPRRCRRR